MTAPQSSREISRRAVLRVAGGGGEVKLPTYVALPSLPGAERAFQANA
ncbi:MAG TPA: hypothetical protein VKV73_25600 [Chloroflexota bacterium]|nr:hypothetical protein [Chloroflexota bacterium]